MSNEKATVAENATIERAYTLRPLKDGDLWPVLAIITAVFPEDTAAIFVKVATGEKSVAEVGAAAVFQIVRAILLNINGKVRDDVYAFLSDVSGIPAAEIPEMEFGTTPMMIWDIVRDTKNASFFKVVSKLL